MTDDIQGAQPVATAERPRGLYTARVDAKGRLKLPSAFQKYLEVMKYKHFYITTTNETTVYIFPLDEWKKKEDRLDNPVNEEEFELFEKLRFKADKYGADAVTDGEGRLMMPQVLREYFQIQDAQVWLQCKKDCIELLNEAEFVARDRGADKTTLQRANMLLNLTQGKAQQ